MVLISLVDHTLSLFVSDVWLSSPGCATLHVELECPTAVEFEPRCAERSSHSRPGHG
jgi:hypothetical protein